MRSAFLLLIALTVVGCTKTPGSNDRITILWDNDKAVSVSIHRALFPPGSNPEVSGQLKISVKGSAFGMLGIVDLDGDVVKFTPPVPFERGQTFEVSFGDRYLSSFTVPLDTTVSRPEVKGSFPSCDTVPENLLKIYVMFNQPMMEGRSAQFVHLLDVTAGDTVNGAFLDLQPELWNEDQTILTLWLDPGRIKQDLIPNRKLGAVLSKDHRYQLTVSSGWRSKTGGKTGEDYERNFVTIQRDSEKPDVTRWSVNVGNRVIIEMKETLDWMLLNHTVSVWKDNQEIEGSIAIEDCDRAVVFNPKQALSPGTYRFEIESRLEDLAGNNLNRLFETDVTNTREISGKDVYTLPFVVK
jgi:hypothetical protein